MKTVSEKLLKVRSSGFGVRSAFQPICLMLFAGLLLCGWSVHVEKSQAPADARVVVEISKESAAMTAGEWVEFETVFRNDGDTATPPLVAHLTITVIDRWRHVDPEDWSPERTQFLPPLAPGESARLSWEIHALFDGAFASFVTLVSNDASFEAITSAPLRLQVAPDSILPLEDVIPVVAVVPLFPLALLAFTVVYARRRRAVRKP